MGTFIKVFRREELSIQREMSLNKICISSIAAQVANLFLTNKNLLNNWAYSRGVNLCQSLVRTEFLVLLHDIGEQ